MKNFKKQIKYLIVLLSIMLVNYSPNVVRAASTVESVNQVIIGEDINHYYFGIIQFVPSHKIVDGEGFGLKKNKYVKQAYVRVRSDGRTFLGITICGATDTGRSYTKAARTKQDKTTYQKKEKVKNCSTCVQRVNYGWIYF